MYNRALKIKELAQQNGNKSPLDHNKCTSK